MPRAVPVDATADVLTVEPGALDLANLDLSSIESEKIYETGEVTPLARISLVRGHRSGPDDTGDPQDASYLAERPKKEGPLTLERKGRLVLGIDFGTSALRAAVAGPKEITRLLTRRGSPELPSAVLVESSGRTSSE
ncbi:MAG: hypothetical protein HC923_02120, partial [Myxococcales bacterium]|nr:hypothetical protein [Myxococcales bacterium]